MSPRAVLFALVALAAVSSAYGQLALCKDGERPATPSKTRITKNVFDISKKLAEVVITFDNPTQTMNGCPNTYTIDMSNTKNTPLGVTKAMPSPIASPISTTFYLPCGEKHFIKAVTFTTKDKKKASNTQQLVILPACAGVTTGRKML